MPVRRYTERRGSGITERDVERVEISAPSDGPWNLSEEEEEEARAALKKFTAGFTPFFPDKLQEIRDDCEEFLRVRKQSVDVAISKRDDYPEYFAAVVVRYSDLIFANIDRHPRDVVMLAVAIGEVMAQWRLKEDWERPALIGKAASDRMAALAATGRAARQGGARGARNAQWRSEAAAIRERNPTLLARAIARVIHKQLPDDGHRVSLRTIERALRR